MQRILSITAAVLLLSLAMQPVAAAPAGWSTLGTHVVQPAETLYCIGRAYGVDPWAIAAQNGIVNYNLIRPGMALAIPAAYATLPAGPACTPQFGSAAPDLCPCTSHYLVASGDTMTGISMTSGVGMWRIAECNGIYNLNYIRAGDTLCIP